MKNFFFVSFICSVALLLTGTHLSAQETSQAAVAASAEVSDSQMAKSDTKKGEASEAPEESGASAAAAPPECFPPCRNGFLCHQGACVSACNPPCETGLTCTPNAECVPAKPAVQIARSPAATPPPASPPATQQNMATAQQNNRLKYRKAGRIMFSSDLAGGTLKDGRINEFSIHFGIGFRKNLTDAFGFSLQTNLLLGFWEDTTVSEADRAIDAEYTTDLTGVDFELMPYIGPIQRFYFGPIVNYRVLRPKENTITVDVDPWYGNDVDVTFPDEEFFSMGLGAGFLLGSKELVNVNWRILSSFTQRMPVYIQAGVSFDLPPIVR